MSELYEHWSFPPIEVGDCNVGQIRRSAQAVISAVNNVSGNGAHELCFGLDEVPRLEDDEAELVADVALAVDALEIGVKLDQVWLIWIDDKDLFSDYVKRNSSIPFGNYHCDYVRIIRQRKLQLAGYPLGRLYLPLNGEPSEGLTGLLQAHDLDTVPFVSNNTKEPFVNTLARISRLPGIVTGLGGHLIRGYPDHRPFEGNHRPMTLTPETWSLGQDNWVHRTTSKPTNGRAIMVADIVNKQYT